MNTYSESNCRQGSPLERKHFADSGHFSLNGRGTLACEAGNANSKIQVRNTAFLTAKSTKSTKKARNPEHGIRTRLRAPRYSAASHASRITHYAFTLIELLVVMAIIAALAAMIFPVLAAVNRAKIRNTARVELAQIETAIEEYKTKLGYYPPDNPMVAATTPPTTNYITNQLYYELAGTSLTNNGVFQTLDGSAQMPQASFSAVFGPSVTGFMNCSKSAASDEAQNAVNFLRDLKSVQFLRVPTGNPNVFLTVLGAPLDGPVTFQDAFGRKINPWNYNSSNPVHNPNSYDLWIDVLIAGTTNRICNWSKDPIINP